MNRWYKAFFVAKIIALLIPSFIGIALFAVVILKFTGTMTDLKILEAKMDSLIGIIGVSVSVWIGLNIYNLIGKHEIEALERRVFELSSIVDDIIPKIKQFDDRMAEEEKRRDFIIKLQRWEHYSAHFRTALSFEKEYLLKCYLLMPRFVRMFKELAYQNEILKEPYPLAYSTFIRLLLVWISIIAPNVQSLTTDAENMGDKISADDIQVGIRSALHEISIVLNEKQEQMLEMIKMDEYDIRNYKEFLIILPKVKDSIRIDDVDAEIAAILEGISNIIQLSNIN